MFSAGDGAAHDRRPGRVGFIAAVAALVLGACGAGGGSGDSGANQTVTAVADGSAPASAAEASASSPAPTTTPPGSPPVEVAPTTAPPDPAAVQSCLDYVHLTTFLGDRAGVDIWERAGSSDDGLLAECSRLASVDATGVAAMRVQLDAINAALLAATTTTTTTTTAPPPPPPVVPAVDLPDCDPNYSGCVPIASDVDCAGGRGNGPAYVDGPVRVIGTDIYGLDGNDNDGIGCES